MKVFVAGATGVVGRRVVPELARRGHSVTANVRSPAVANRISGAGVAPVTVDLFDAAAVARVVEGHDVVINLATHIPHSSWRVFVPGAWRENDRLRREASRHLADAVVRGGARRFIQESYAPVYPDRGDAWIDERTPIAPVRYNRTVADAERSAQSVTERGGVGIVLRFGGFYGPDSPQLAEMANMVRRGWWPLPGGPDAWWSSVSHDDAASAVVAALEAPAGVYNVVDDRPMRRQEWANAFADALGVRHPRFMPAWTTHLMGSLGEMFARSLRMSNAKLRAATHWSPRYPSAADGIPAAVAPFTRQR